MLKPIQTTNEHAAAQKRVEELKQKQLQPGFAESEELELLMELISLYEERGAISFDPERDIFIRKNGKEYVNDLLIDFMKVSSGQ